MPKSSRPLTTIRGQNITFLRCSRIRRGAYTWAMCATTRWATWWRAIGAHAGSTCCTRWVGTRLACRRRTRRRRTTPIRRNGPTPISRRCGRNCNRWACRSTGRARSRPAIRAITSISRSCSGLPRRGLVTRKKSKVNWDPVDQTVLANEQVIERARLVFGAIVEQRVLTQWFLKITDYSDELLANLERLDRWPEKVRLMQKNWIGRSEGLLIRFVIDPATLGALAGEPGTATSRSTHPPGHVFRHDAWQLSPTSTRSPRSGQARPCAGGVHRRTRRIGTSVAAIETAEKRGYDTGLKVTHPFDPSWRLPVYVANFVLMEYGTGAIFGCPAHDQRDLDFVRAYGLGVTPVVCPAELDPANFFIDRTAYDGNGVMINSRFLDGMTVEAAKEEVARRLEQITLGDRPQAKRQVNYKLRDWAFRAAPLGLPDPDHPLRSVRRGAGPGRGSAGQAAGGRDVRPIGQSARPPSDLEARRVPAMRRTGDARNRHDGHLRQFVVVFRPLHRSGECGGRDRSKDGRPLARGRQLYSAASSTRSCIFSIRASFTRAMRKCGYLDLDEPFAGLFTQGMVVHETYSDGRGQWLAPSEIRVEGDGDRRRAFLVEGGEPVEIGPIEKMSKSKRNTIDPDEIIATYGADTARWFMLRIRLPSATSSGRKPASRGRTSRSSACGASPVKSNASSALRVRRRRRIGATRRGGSAGSPTRRWPGSRTRSTGSGSMSASPRFTS